MKALNHKPRAEWTFGEKMLFYRMQLGINQQEAAKRAGMNKGYWNRLENGCYLNPHLSIVKRVAQALGVFTSSLVD